MTERNDKNLSEKRILCFIDFEKVFDNANILCFLWSILEKMGYPRYLTNGIKSLYVETWMVLELTGKLSDKIKMNKGVRYGCYISLILFNICIGNIVCRWKTLYNRKIDLDRNTTFNVLLCANNFAIIDKDENNL